MRILFKKSKHTGKVIHFSFTKLRFANKIIDFFYFLLNNGCSSTIVSRLFHCCFTVVFQPCFTVVSLLFHCCFSTDMLRAAPQKQHEAMQNNASGATENV